MNPFEVGDKARFIEDDNQWCKFGKAYDVIRIIPNTMWSPTGSIEIVDDRGNLTTHYSSRFEKVEEDMTIKLNEQAKPTTKKPHKHAELIKAWADGAEIQMKNVFEGVWVSYEEYEDPSWNINYEYRIKPEPKPDIVRWGNLTTNGEDTTAFWYTAPYHTANMKATYDGETHKLKSVEML